MSRQVATTVALEEPEAATATENGLQDEPDIARQAATEAVAETPMHPQEPRYEAATGHDTLRQAATESAPPIMETPVPQQEQRQEARQARHAATGRDRTGHDRGDVALCRTARTQLEVARDERDFLREQINRKDRTIDALIERDRETNYLVRGLQEMLTPFWAAAARKPPPGIRPSDPLLITEKREDAALYLKEARMESINGS